MRTQAYNPYVSLMKYQIREIVDVAQKLSELIPEFKVENENIGDPIARGHKAPQLLKDLVKKAADDDKTYGYSHSRGYPSTRHWVTEYAKRFSPSSELNFEYVLFASGLGAGISALYHMLPEGVRVIQPTPSYPTHASMESFSAKAESISYKLDPDKDWQPDLENLEEQLQKHPDVGGILVINPNNPTGAVYSKETVEKIVALAEKYQCFILSDEVYFRMVYNGHEYTQLTEVAHKRVPLIVMRGTSKDIPWPGGRCGWLEFHNTELDKEFLAYAESVKKRILMEVCSTTLPQMLVPSIYDHPDFEDTLKSYNAQLELNSNQIADILSQSPYLKVNRTNGAFYMMPLFKEGVLNDKQTLPIENEAARSYIESQANREGVPLDLRFCYYLLANTGICVVPATGFFSPYYGFRLTTLDLDEERRKRNYANLVEAIERYVLSTS